MSNWVKALLDPEEIPQSPASKKKHISPPPKFEMATDKTILPPLTNGPTSRARGKRSTSPSKIASPTKKDGSPRKPRQTKAMKEAAVANANAASAKLQAELDDAASMAPSESVVSEPEKGDKVKVEVESSVEVNGEIETTHTNIAVEMPAGSPELPLPEDTETAIATAKKMVEAAVDHEADSSSRKSKKRKADDVEDDIDGDLPTQPTKKARVLQEKLKREKVRSRALIGVTATVALAYVLLTIVPVQSNEPIIVA